MATIKEMADEYARTYLFSPQDGKGPDDHYAEGANAVLEEIEALMSNGNDKFPYTCIDSIQNLIKQLKGE